MFDFRIIFDISSNVRMRSFQVMRYGRRSTPTASELAQSIIQSSSLTAAKRRSSLFACGNEQRQNSYQYAEDYNSIAQRLRFLFL